MTKSVPGNVRGPARRRVVPLWRTKWATGFAGLAVAGGIGAGIWWIVDSGVATTAYRKTHAAALSGTVALGFRIEEILVTGRGETSQKDLLAAVGLHRGAPIFAFDPAAARAKIEALPWVKSATVERMLPNTVVLRIRERRPLAIWQSEGRFALIDGEGRIIKRDGLERYAGMLLVVGEDAPSHTADLVRMLAVEPTLRDRVKAAVRVGGRRWNVRLKNDVDVRLPEENPAEAWKRLAEYDRRHGVLERDVQILDLRIPDRLIVRKAPKSAATAADDKET